MSAVKILAFGSLLVTFAVRSALGESIHSAGRSAPPTSRLTSTAPTSLVYGSPVNRPIVSQNTTHAVSAQNLATTSPYYSQTSYGSDGGSAPASSGYTQGSVTGLFLGVSGGNVGSPSNANAPSSNGSGSAPAVVQINSTPTFSSPAPAPTPAISSNSADAFINFGSGPYPEASSLTSGNAQPFFNSPAFTNLFGAKGPTSSDITNFENEVLSTIKSTYNNAGLAINLTTDPNATAAHTMSVVSGASFTGTPGAVGITDVGNNGFSFIDKFGAAKTPDELAIAIGHNLSHELMHAFGIANHPEQTGPYVDAATATIQTLSDPSTGFSLAAASLLSTLNFQATGQSVTAGAQRLDGNQILIPSDPTPVPEPSTIPLWTLAGGLVIAVRRKKARRASAIL